MKAVKGDLLMKKPIALILFFGIACSSCMAGGQPDQKHTEKIKQQVIRYLNTGDRVSLETYDQRKLQGAISESRTDSFVLTIEGRSATLNYSEVKKIKSFMSRSKKQMIATIIVTGALFGMTAILLSQDK